MTARGLSGVWPIVATPFRDDGSPDEGDLARLVDFLVDSGVDGIVFPGVASEVETLAPAERESLVEAVAAANRGRVGFIVGASAADAAAAAGYAAHARGTGAVGVMAMLPPALAGDAAGQVAYYRRVAQAGLPVVLQNAPPPAGCGLTPERVVAIIDEVPGVAYVKEEALPCGQRITRILALAPSGLAGVFGGAGGRYLPDELARGACGTMPAAELADLFVRLCARHRAGDAEGARKLFDRMLPLLNFQAVFRMAMTKEVLKRRGVIAATRVRAAGPSLDAGDRRELDALLDDVADLVPQAPGAAPGPVQRTVPGTVPGTDRFRR